MPKGWCVVQHSYGSEFLPASSERSTETEEDTTKQELGAALLPDAKQHALRLKARNSERKIEIRKLMSGVQRGKEKVAKEAKAAKKSDATM